MKRYIKSWVAALLAVVIIFSAYVPVMAAGQPSKYSSTYNSGERDVVCTTLNGTSALSYYGSNYDYDKLSAMSSTQLLNSLRSLMKSTHSYYSSYDDCKEYASKTDCENENGKVLLLYTSVTSTQSAANSGWNREHVWPKSLGGYNTSGAGSDLHHIRPSDNRVNSCRGNLKYGNLTSGTNATGGNAASGVSGGTYGSYFEPLDNVKGDVARICLYMYVRYGGESQYTCGNITTVFQSIDVLLEWCEMDPVDTWEMGRNEVVEEIQGNRNVFIDYPEYAWLIFSELDENGEETRPLSNKLETPSGLANEIGINVCEHENKDYVNKADADCTNDGYTGDLYCPDCEETLEVGTVIPNNENLHKFVEWTPTEDGFSYERECEICGEHQIISVNNIFDRIDSDAEKILLILTLAGSDFLFTDAIVGETEKQ